tara:strand:+ start:297 stop:416 length:120 start_codon:yes stop_codon:yes gene_type:complete
MKKEEEVKDTPQEVDVLGVLSAVAAVGMLVYGLYVLIKF